MSYERRPYDEPDSTRQMALDGAACADEPALRPALRLDYASDARSKTKRDLRVSDAAAHLAAGLHLR